jgi:hypothetical protein
MRTKNCNIQTVKATSRVDALVNGASLINAHARKGTDHRAKFCLSTAVCQSLKIARRIEGRGINSILKW